MAETKPSVKNYFIGVGGEQLGPFTHAEISEKILAKSLSSETLVWHEGLPDWAPIGSLEEFKALFGATSETPKATPVTASAEPQTSTHLVETQLPPEEALSDRYRPVFDATPKPSGVSLSPQQKKRLMVIGIVAAVIAGSGYLWLMWEASDFHNAKEPTKKPIHMVDARELQFNEAVSQLILDPQHSIPTLEELIKTRSDDVVGKEAIQALVDYYNQLQRPGDAGHVYMEASRPADAAPLLIQDPRRAKEAETAYFAAFQKEKGEARRAFLLKDVQLLLTPPANLPLAIERIKLLGKEFPSQPNPYAYYLKSTDEQIHDLFSRVSFFYVQSLLNYLSSELPQINFLYRPLVEIRKSPAGTYRILATYQGDVLLNQDRLKNIYFVFWLSGEQWFIVDTNLTRERQVYAAKERERHQNDTLDGARMLHQLEGVFRTQFPKSELHENVKPPAVDLESEQ